MVILGGWRSYCILSNSEFINERFLKFGIIDDQNILISLISLVICRILNIFYIKDNFISKSRGLK